MKRGRAAQRQRANMSDEQLKAFETYKLEKARVSAKRCRLRKKIMLEEQALRLQEQAAVIAKQSALITQLQATIAGWQNGAFA